MHEDFEIEDMVEQTQRFVSYKALHRDSGRKFLVRRYLIDRVAGLGKVANWQDEFSEIVEQFSRIEGVHLHNLINGGEDFRDNSPYAVFEWLDKFTLAQFLKETSRLKIRVVIEIASSTLDALSILHDKGVIHGDVCPKNIYYAAGKESSRWGLLWDPVCALRCKHGVHRSNLDVFIAPEINEGLNHSKSSDLYAVGQVVKSIAGPVEKDHFLYQWLTKITAYSADARFGSAKDALMELLELKHKITDTAPVTTKTKKEKVAPISEGDASIKSQKVAPLNRLEGRKIILVLCAILLVGLALLIAKKSASKKEEVSTSTPVISPETGIVSSDKSEPGVKEILQSNIITSDWVLSPDDIDKIKERDKKVAVVRGTVADVFQSKSKKTTYFSFGGEEGGSNVPFLKLQAHTGEVLGGKSLEQLQEMFSGKVIEVKGKITYEQLLQGYYLRFKSIEDLTIH